MTAVANKLGLSVDFVPMASYSSILNRVARAESDLGAAQYVLTPQRLKVRLRFVE